MLKKFWLIWARTLDHRVGRTDDDEPDIPILSLKDAQISLLIRTIKNPIIFFKKKMVNFT